MDQKQLKEKYGLDGYYEYKVLNVYDRRGKLDIQDLTDRLNELGKQGWSLKAAYSNELGKNTVSVAGFGVNSTSDQNILILQRFVKFKEEKTEDELPEI